MQTCPQCLAWTSCVEGSRLLDAFLHVRQARLCIRPRRRRRGRDG
jgi:hypothetical protein